VVIASQSIGFQALPPAQSFRGALLYPTCAADRSDGPHNGRLYCSWMDGTPQGTTDILLSVSDDRGGNWSAPVRVADPLSSVDRFFPWLSVDPVTGDVNVSFYDTRNDTTGFRYMTDVYFSQSNDGGVTWAPNTRVSSASSDEHDCGGLFPCSAIDYGNQYGDYEGLVSFGGVSHAIWTDSRDNQTAATGCRTNLVMEEVFTATVVKQRVGRVLSSKTRMQLGRGTQAAFSACARHSKYVAVVVPSLKSSPVPRQRKWLTQEARRLHSGTGSMSVIGMLHQLTVLPCAPALAITSHPYVTILTDISRKLVLDQPASPLRSAAPTR
jgi:hypothetical protein